jgi:hypothetical protein
MRKGLAYLDFAEKCRKLASQLKEPRQKKILEDMAQSWETVARQRAKQLAKSARPKARRKSQ